MYQINVPIETFNLNAQTPADDYRISKVIEDSDVNEKQPCINWELISPDNEQWFVRINYGDK